MTSLARLLTGLFIVFAGLMLAREFEPILFFRPVEVIVVSSGVATGHFDRRLPRTHDEPWIVYRYQVNGEEHESRRYRRTNVLGLRSEAERQAARYVVGRRAQAWYNPGNPADAVLSRGVDPWLFALLGGLGILVWLFAREAAARRKLVQSVGLPE